MSARRTPSSVQPVAGERFRAAARLRPGGEKRRRVVALLAAFEDAGQPSTSAFDISARLGLELRTAQALLQRLADDGFLQATRNTARRRHPRYRLVALEHLPGEGIAPSQRRAEVTS